MQREELPKHLRALAVKFAAAQEKGRSANNEANRVKTELRNGIKEYWTKNYLPIGSYIRAMGIEFTYGANVTSTLDADAVLKMYDSKKITREQMVRLFNVDRTEAKKILGADVVADLEIESVGDKLDVRTKELPIEDVKDEYVMVRRKVRVKIKRSVFGQEVADREARKANKDAVPALRRRIKLRK